MQPGDIVFVEIWHADGGSKVRPCLVYRVQNTVGADPTVTVAYGTSKRTTRPQPWHILVTPEDGHSAWMTTGLARATVFCFDQRIVLSREQMQAAKLVGSLHISMARRLESAIAQAIKRGWR